MLSAEKEGFEPTLEHQYFQYVTILIFKRHTYRHTNFFKVYIIQGKNSVLVREKQIFELKTQIFLFSITSFS